MPYYTVLKNGQPHAYMRSPDMYTENPHIKILQKDLARARRELAKVLRHGRVPQEERDRLRVDALSRSYSPPAGLAWIEDYYPRPHAKAWDERQTQEGGGRRPPPP